MTVEVRGNVVRPMCSRYSQPDLSASSSYHIRRLYISDDIIPWWEGFFRGGFHPPVGSQGGPNRLPGEHPRRRQAGHQGAVLGLRWSEVAGLRVGALDLPAGTVSVREVRVRTAHHERVTGPPKSEAGRRTMAIPDPLVELLAEHLRRQGLTASDAYVFTSSDGQPLDYVNWRRRVWLPACRSVGLEGTGFHDLRRAAVTALVLGGVDIKTAGTRAGHSDVRLTLQTYAQASTTADRAAAGVLAEHFFGGSALEARDDREMTEVARGQGELK